MESKNVESGLKLESRKLESKGVEVGLELESTSHRSDKLQEDNTE